MGIRQALRCALTDSGDTVSGTLISLQLLGELLSLLDNLQTSASSLTRGGIA